MDVPGDVVARPDGQPGVDRDVQVGLQAVTEPAGTAALHGQHAGDFCRSSLDPLEGVGFDPVHEAPHHGPHRGHQHGDDDRGDDQAHDGIQLRESGPGAHDADDHGQRGEGVGAGVLPLGDEGGGADASAGADAIDRDRFVAERPDESGGQDPAQVGELARLAQGAHRLPDDERSGGGDDQTDQQPDQVLGALEAIAVAPRRRPSAEPEGDDQRDGRGQVAQVVYRVGQQGHGPAEGDDHELQHRGQAHADQADPGRPDALAARLVGALDAVGVIVAVWCEGVTHPAPPAVLVLEVV